MKTSVNLTMEQFKDSKRVIDNPQAIRQWFEDNDKMNVFAPGILSLLVYMEAHYIQQDTDTGYSMVIESATPSGSLAEMEEVLYQWAFL